MVELSFLGQRSGPRSVRTFVATRAFIDFSVADGLHHAYPFSTAAYPRTLGGAEKEESPLEVSNI